MRLTFMCSCGTALALASSVAVAADSRVTLYGLVDTYIRYLGNGGTHSFSEQSSGASASMFGVSGSEDLGSGLKLRFALESGFTHLGRFSIAYRATYGEPPTATRARARATSRSRS